MTRPDWLSRAADYLRQLEAREGPVVPGPREDGKRSGADRPEEFETSEAPPAGPPRASAHSPRPRQAAPDIGPARMAQSGSLFTDGTLPPEPPWKGEPPRAEVDPVGIPESMTCPIPEEAEERAGLLARFQREIGACLKCPLGETRTHFVFGAGSPDADIMFIGEAPGAEEDARGEPFVGRAGKLLDRIIEAIGFRREDVFIANILKCRPPNNRDPQALEVEACEPYLRRQIAVIRPAVICALGRVAGQTLLKTSQSLTRMRQQVHRYEGRPLVVTYHPAALLRNPNWKRPTWEDMQQLKEIHDQEVGA